MTRKYRAIWLVVGIVLMGGALELLLRLHPWRSGEIALEGSTIRRDPDSRKELPISQVTITASDGRSDVSTQSDDSGYFRIPLPGLAWLGRSVTLTFRHEGYVPLTIPLPAGFRSADSSLLVAAMTPTMEGAVTGGDAPASVVSNIRVRYTVNSETEENIGSAVRTFQVIHHGTAACDGKSPCSPDKRWQAATASVTLDAGTGNEFRNARASCIAGPCPFTRIDSSGFDGGGRTITASAVDWSDTATFLVEAEVFRGATASNVRELYPVVFGQALNFTLPPVQEGVSIEADVDNTPMVFPLGPNLYLSWAECTARVNEQEAEKTTVYRCELKPGYRF